MIYRIQSLIRSINFWDRMLVLGISLFCLALFLPSITAVERIGLIVATAISCLGGRWRVSLNYLKHPLLVLLAVFLGWLALSSVWSLEPAVTLKSWWNIFKDYFLFAVPMFYLLADEQRRQLLAIALALCGAVIVVLNGIQYLNELFTAPELLLNIKTHRGWGHPLVFFLPFVMLQAALAKGREAVFWYGLFAIKASMIFATGARGSWLALVVVLISWGVLREYRRRISILLAIGLAIAALSYLTLPAPFFKDRIAHGADTTLRTTGTWGPALQMMDERPWQGFGFGKSIFDREFDRRAPSEERWSIKKSKGPHSIYLEAGFAGGYPGLVLVGVLFIATFAYGLKAVLSLAVVDDKVFALAAWSSFSGYYITRGAFESVSWDPMIILLVIIVYCSRSKPARCASIGSASAAPTSSHKSAAQGRARVDNCHIDEPTFMSDKDFEHFGSGQQS